MRWGISLAAALAALACTAAAAVADDMTFAPRNALFPGGEPTLGTLKDGSIVYQALSLVIKSTDDGVTWKQVHQPPTADTSLDPYLHVDTSTDRIISSQLLGACQMLSISDDGGASWTDAPTQCGTVDHQKIASGPWAAPVASPAYPRAVYSCFNHVAETACATSVNGGLTWGPPVTAFAGEDPSTSNGLNGVPGFCGGLEGDPVSGPDGAIYLPREYCGRPFLAISHDNGLTWTSSWVAPPAETRPIGYGANNPGVDVGPDGTIYYVFTGADWRHHLAISTDGGTHWTERVVSPSDVLSTTFPVVIAGAAGHVATAYLGTRDTDKGPDGAPATAKWHLFITSSFDGTAADPTWQTAQATPLDDPVMIGCIGRHGGGCSAAGHSGMLDFNDMALLPGGRLVVSYTDACLPLACTNSKTSTANQAYVAVQTGGPVIG
jgi:hypothetical protein